MKTIFDYDPTKEELNDLFGNLNITPADLRSNSNEYNNFVLCELFHKRGDQSNLNLYLSKLPEMRQADFFHATDHLVNS